MTYAIITMKMCIRDRHIAVIFQRQVKVVVLVGSGGLKRYGDDVRRHFDVDKTELVGIILAVKRPDDRKIL